MPAIEYEGSTYQITYTADDTRMDAWKVSVTHEGATQEIYIEPSEDSSPMQIIWQQCVEEVGPIAYPHDLIQKIGMAIENGGE